MSQIEWTDKTWNPTAGCSLVSAGCDVCYAVPSTWRYGHNSTHNGKYEGLVDKRPDGTLRFNGKVRLWEPHLETPLTYKKPLRWFVNSMSNVFHPALRLESITRVFDVIGRANWHAFQILTKRPDRAAKLSSDLTWHPNILMGTSVEDDRVLDRIDWLRQVPAFTRFLSLEPLIGPVGELNLEGIHWVIAGGESGPTSKVRPMDVGWVRDIRDQCVSAGVAFSFKQYGKLSNNPDPNDPTAKENGSKTKTKGGCTLDGKVWGQHPAVPGFYDRHAIGDASPPLLTDDQWQQVASLVPGRDGTPGGRGADNRAFLNAARWKAWTGKPWRDLPEEHQPWNSAAVRVDRWRQGDHWPGILEELQDPYLARLVEKRRPRPRRRAEPKREGKNR